MVKPLGNEDLSEVVGERVIDKPELPAPGITNETEAQVEMVAGALQLKRGASGRFEIFSDEPPRTGGADEYPTPMSYLALAIGF